MRKCLSILLVLFMILGSLPVMAFTASAETTDPNIMANYTASNFGKWRWDSINTDATVANGNGSSLFYVKGPGSQNIFTTVTLEPNSSHKFSFKWYSKEIDGGKSYVSKIAAYPVEDGVDVYNTKQHKVFDFTNYNTASEADLAEYEKNVWYEGTVPTGYGSSVCAAGSRYNGYVPAMYNTNVYGVDVVESYSAGSQVNGSWQSATADITTGENTKYIVIIYFGSTGNRDSQQIYLDDFELINPSSAALVTPMENKKASGWFPWEHSRVYDDNSLVQPDGTTSTLRVEKPVYQRMATNVTLEPNKRYIFSFDWYSVSHTSGDPRVSNIKVYPIGAGDAFDTNSWRKEGGYINANGYASIANKVTVGSGVENWVTATADFITTAETKYVIVIEFLAVSGGFHNDQKIYLSDFKLDGFVKSKPGNILNNACYDNGDVSWTVDTGNMEDLAPRGSFESGLDNPAFAIYGGYAWGFGFANNSGNLVGDKYARVHIKAKGLKANATYDFSYIYADGFRFRIDSIKSGNNSAAYIVDPAYTEIGNPTSNPKITNGAEKATAMFTVPVDGDYVITLKSNRDDTTGYNTWRTTYLCDLELYERGAMYKVSLSKEGYGSASASKIGIVEEGETVTFTAKPEIYERFIGWYVGDQLLSKDATYTATVNSNLNVVAKFTTNSQNLMADYTAANIVPRYHGASSNSNVSRYGGNGIYISNAPLQRTVTKVNLEAGKNYRFSVEWKAAENQYNRLFPNGVEVVKINDDKNILDKANWNESCVFSGSVGADIESGGTYGNQTMANSGEWNTFVTSFTPTESGEYGIIIHTTFEKQDFGDGKGPVHKNNGQSIYYSDFSLKAQPELTGPKYEWRGVRWSSVSDSTETYDGGRAYHVNQAMSQNINTTLNLKPATTYKFSFNWKAVADETGLAYVAKSSIYSANSGNPELPGKDNKDPNWGKECNYKYESWGDYTPVYNPNEGYSDLMTNVVNNYNANNMSSWLDWNSYSATFTTIEDAEYYLFINFGLKVYDGKTSSYNQAVIISDVIIEEVVKGDAPECDEMVEHRGISIRKASESNFGQALRYKFTVDGNVIAKAQTDGYELVEYGTVVAFASELEGHAADPVFGATSYTVKTGVAYQKAFGGEPTTNIQYSVATNGDVTYTAALYGIPVASYSADCAVRPYAKFQNAEGDTYIRYGATRVASVFAVAKSVLEGDSVDDITYVNNVLLAGSIKDAYNEWLAK